MSSATATKNAPNASKKQTSFFGKLSEFVFGAKGEDMKAPASANLETEGIAPISQNASAFSGSSNTSQRNNSAAAAAFGPTGAVAPQSPAGAGPNVEKGFTAATGNTVSVMMPGRGGKRRGRTARRRDRKSRKNTRRYRK